MFVRVENFAGKHALVVLSRVEADKIVSFAVISTYFK